MVNRTDDRTELLQGTLVLRTLEAMGPLHGYAIAQRLQQVSREMLRLNQGTLYPALLRLEHNGLVASKWGTTENNRKARYYSITRAGRKRLAEEAGNWERVAEMINRVLAGAF